jgi:hypothetical protein
MKTDAPVRDTLVITILAVVGTLPACSRSQSSDITAIVPGDTEYPTVNPNPAQSIDITASVAPSLSVTLLARYETSTLIGSCQKSVGLAVTAPFSVSKVIPLNASRGASEGRVIVDAFSPGRCQWHFVGVQFVIKDGWPPIGAIATYRDAPSGIENLTLEKWCLRDHVTSSQNDVEECGALAEFPKTLLEHPSLSAVPESARGSQFPLELGPASKHIAVTFNDLDLWLREHP